MLAQQLTLWTFMQLEEVVHIAGRAHVWPPRHGEDDAGQGCCHRVPDDLLQCFLLYTSLKVQVCNTLGCNGRLKAAAL